jgi:hypothetical protein
MASEPHQDQEQHEERQAHAANMDATQREAYEYWGYLLKSDKCGTELLDRLLKGIAGVIVSRGELHKHLAVGDSSADHVTVEHPVRAQRLARSHTVANRSLVSRRRRQLRRTI